MSIKKKTDLKIPNEQSVQTEEGQTTQRSTNEKVTQLQVLRSDDFKLAIGNSCWQQLSTNRSFCNVVST
jgi:hypothetical protein